MVDLNDGSGSGSNPGSNLVRGAHVANLELDRHGDLAAWWLLVVHVELTGTANRMYSHLTVSGPALHPTSRALRYHVSAVYDH